MVDYSSLLEMKHTETPDEEFKRFIAQMPDKHWAKLDISAVRFGWEAHKLLKQE